MVTRLLLGSLFIVPLLLSPRTVVGNEKAEAKVSTEDRYQVPEGNTESLLAFIDGLRNFRPSTVTEFKEHRTRFRKSITMAAERILKIEKDPNSPASRQAKQIVLDSQIRDLAETAPEEHVKLYADLERFIKGTEQLTVTELELAYMAASGLERLGNDKLAKEAYATFGELFASNNDDRLKSYGEKMLSVARRLDLPGNSIDISGRTLAGTEFDWESYRGKVVLIDFWATWCPPCVAELPNVKKQYEKYHDRGFDVVGISLDQDAEGLETFIKERELPWVTLFDGEAGPEHPVAMRYGITAIPQVILVDREGLVVSMDAHGEELERQLENLLGPSTEAHAKVE